MSATDHTATCNCEHIDHDTGRAHAMFAAPLGDDARHVAYIGAVCGECARGHMAHYVLPDA